MHSCCNISGIIVVIVISCGPLLKKPGVIKTPVAQNYLDGDVVTFSCKPDFYIHGDAERRCINGTWSPGWWVWCRNRWFEYALKWITGVVVTLAIILIIMAIFCCCWRRRVSREQSQIYRTGEPKKIPPPPTAGPYRGYGNGPPEYDHEPVRVGLAGNGNGPNHKPPMVTTA